MPGGALAVPVVRAPRTTRGARSDAALVDGAARGDEAALAQLFRRHWPAAHRTAWLVVHDERAAEDIAQEAFLAAVRRLDGFDRRRPFAPWLHRIVINRAIDHARTRAARREVAGDGLPEARAPEEARQALGDATLLALARLAPEQRAVVVLRHLLGYRPREVAEMLELPVGTVNSRLRRALDALSVELER